MLIFSCLLKPLAQMVYEGAQSERPSGQKEQRNSGMNRRFNELIDQSTESRGIKKQTTECHVKNVTDSGCDKCENCSITPRSNETNIAVGDARCDGTVLSTHTWATGTSDAVTSRRGDRTNATELQSDTSLVVPKLLKGV